MSDRTELEAVIAWWRRTFDPSNPHNRNATMLLQAAEAHLATLPKTTTVPCWYVEYAYRSRDGWVPAVASVAYRSEADAEEIADAKRREGCACVRVSGPHRREIPA